MNILIDHARDRLRHSFLLRWVLANMVGWTLGLYLTTISVNSWVIILLGGLAYGGVVGVAQRYVLRHYPSIQLARWLAYSLYGGLCGTLVSILFIFPYLFSSDRLLALVIGGLIGTSLGAWQSFLMSGSARWWVGANLLGGALCGLLTTIPIIRGLPIGLLLGAAVFGYVTGRALEKMKPER